MKNERKITLIIIATCVLMIIIFTIIFIIRIFSSQVWQVNTAEAAELQETYKAKVSTSTDLYYLMDQGSKLLNGNQPRNALMNFQRATELDKNYRDGWVWLGYAQIQNDDPASAITSLKNAEAIDPIYAQTYELLTIAYEKTGDAEAASNAKEKMQFLTKQK
ncbi:TPA: hypothetical protein DIV55_02965 [Patescibacteria group bacterium]|nr:hypothetical protein [Patescibacteria group bacterium]